jgi:hypothetical protein
VRLQFAALTKERHTGRRSWDAGWTSSAQPWLLTEVTPGLITSGVFTVPAGMKAVVDGRFVLLLKDGNRIGAVTVSRSSCWGLRGIFQRRGGEPGDFVLLRFDLKTRECVAQLGSDRESLLESVEQPDALSGSREPSHLVEEDEL